MDGKRFDFLTRELTRATSRRRIVAGLIAIVAGGGTLADAEAGPQRRTCRPVAASCLRAADCCSGRCDTRRSTPRNRRNRCACPDGLVMCGSACFDAQTDAAHCGACGQRCAESQACSSGACICVPNCDGKTCGDDGCGGSCGTCDSSTKCADGACIDLCTDWANNTDAEECIVTAENLELYHCGLSWEEGNYGPQPCETSAQCALRASTPNAYCAVSGGGPGFGTWDITPPTCWVHIPC
jgi:hypothetical protein